MLGDPVNFVDPEGLLGLKDVAHEVGKALWGEAEGNTRKKAFCDMCTTYMEQGKSDKDACNDAAQQAVICMPEDAGCRKDVAVWVVNGCVETCKDVNTK